MFINLENQVALVTGASRGIGQSIALSLGKQKAYVIGTATTEDGAIWLLGRVDDVMNVSGHRISTTEVESALVSHEAVAEAAVVGAKDEMTGQAIVAFVIFNDRHFRIPKLFSNFILKILN